MVYPALLPLMHTPRLPVVDWTDASADLNGVVRFTERRNLVSARVPSHFSWPLSFLKDGFRVMVYWRLKKTQNVHLKLQGNTLYVWTVISLLAGKFQVSYESTSTWSPLSTWLSRRAQLCRWSSFGKPLWFTEWHIVLVIYFYSFYLLDSFLI
jgi:hypothetical protein